jgi:phosphoenolpyruvate-protein kinase (PTS system EI component)
LIQYLFAVDRDNEFVAYDHHPDRKVFWQLIRHVAAAAKKHRKPLSVCGELAANPVYARKLIQEGVRTVSVAAKMIPGLRIAIKNKPKLAFRAQRSTRSEKNKKKLRVERRTKSKRIPKQKNRRYL